MIQDQSLFTVATGATVKPTVMAANKFSSQKSSFGAKAIVPTQARSFRQAAAPVMAMNNDKTGLSMSMERNQVAHQFQKMGSAFNRTLDNAAQNLNNIINGQSQNPYLATSAGPMAMQGTNFSAFQNAGSNQTPARATPSMGSSLNAVQALTAKRSVAPKRANTVMMAGPTVSGDSPSMNDDHMDKAMVAKMGINGFGRIGRLVFRSTFMHQKDKACVVAINAPGKSLEYLKYLLEFDSVHGRFPGTVEIGDGALIVNGQEVKVFDSRDPADIDWAKAGVEYLCESTGVFLTQDSVAGHLKGGVKKVIFAAPAKDDTPTFVYGVNQDKYNSDMKVVSNASCTTNCLAPLSKVINDKFGIEEGLMTTCHATTASNVTVDGTSNKDWRGGRANGPNIIPSSTGAAKAVGLVIPELKGKLTGMAFRVPTTNVSVVDLTVKLKNEATWDEICQAVKDAQAGDMAGVVEFVDGPLVSQDFVSYPVTSCFDAQAGIQLSPKFVKLVAWYDNEWAYSNQLVKLTHFMAEKDGALVERAMAAGK